MIALPHGNREKIIFIAQKLWEFRHQFVRYFLVGISAFALDIGSLYALKEYFGFTPVYAVITNQPFIIAIVFWINKHWSFKAGGETHTQFVRFITLALVNYAISVGWMWIFAHVIGVHYLIAKVANIILAVSWNFLAYKYWVYR